MKKCLYFLMMCAALSIIAGCSKQEGALSKRFSVSAHKQVYFSQGNLQYNISSDLWRFADNQWTTIGENRNYKPMVKEGWIDVFCWGTGDNPTAQSSKEPSLSWFTDPSKSGNAEFTTFTDWGINPISNGGDKPNQWRTLTAGEWQYLIKYRTNANKRLAYATVNGIEGLILLPDKWSNPRGISLATIEDYEDNIFATDTWKKLEASGAVFLPEINSSSCQYWSSTPEYDESGSMNCCYSYYFYLGGHHMIPTNSAGRASFLSVRLVCDAK